MCPLLEREMAGSGEGLTTDGLIRVMWKTTRQGPERQAEVLALKNHGRTLSRAEQGQIRARRDLCGRVVGGLA